MRQATFPTAASALPLLLLLLSLSSCAVNSTARREKAAGNVPVSSAASVSTLASTPAPAPSSVPPAVEVPPAVPAKVPSLAAATVVDPGNFEKSSAALTEPFLEKPDSFFDKDRTTVSGSISVAVGYEKTSYPRVNRIGRNSSYGSVVPGSP